MEKVETGEEVLADPDNLSSLLGNVSLSDKAQRTDLEVIRKVELEVDLVQKSTTETLTKLSRLLGHCSATTVGTCQENGIVSIHTLHCTINLYIQYV